MSVPSCFSVGRQKKSPLLFPKHSHWRKKIPIEQIRKGEEKKNPKHNDISCFFFFFSFSFLFLSWETFQRYTFGASYKWSRLHITKKMKSRPAYLHSWVGYYCYTAESAQYIIARAQIVHQYNLLIFAFSIDAIWPASLEGERTIWSNRTPGCFFYKLASFFKQLTAR